MNYKQENSIECDNPACNYKVPYSQEVDENMKDWINKPCPLCGENLLTDRDYEDYLKFKEVINGLGKLGLLEGEEKDEQTLKVKIHDGFTLNIE